MNDSRFPAKSKYISVKFLRKFCFGMINKTWRKSKMRIPIALLLIFLILGACNSKQVKEQNNFTLILPDTSKTHQPHIFYENKKYLTEELNLRKLEFNTDSFELRLWVKFELITGGQVYSLKKINSQWTCLHYSYYEQESDSPVEHEVYDNISYFTVDSISVKKKTPKSGWSKFLGEIEDANIYNLPDQSDIKGWENLVTDGNTFYVEYATKTKYKFYSYNCPDLYEDDFVECRQMIKILEIFNKEIGIDVGLNGNYRCRQE